MKAKRTVILVALAAATAAGAGASWLFGRAKITGDTLQERIESVYRIAADRPRGAAKALAGAAAEAPEPELRRAAMAGLLHFATPPVRATVEKGLSDPDAEVRAIAAGGLGAYGDKAAADRLIETIEKEPDDDARWAAMAALARCDDPRAVVVLLNKADQPGDRDDRVAAMKALAGKLLAALDPTRVPENDALWRDLVQRIKRMQYVQKAFADANAPLIQRPSDILHDAHPERRTGDWPPSPAEGHDHEHDD